MAIEKTKAMFRTSDGREFEALKDAERHEALIKAKSAFDDAKRMLVRAFAESQKTADGYPFSFGAVGPYYHIQHGWSGLPRLGTVYISFWDCALDERDDELKLTEWSHDQKTGTYRKCEWRISSLYWREENAKRALVTVQEEWLAQQTATVEMLRKEVTK